MARLPVHVVADPDDERALQAWVDVNVDGTLIRMLLDTGSARSAVPATAAVGAAVATTVPLGRGVSGDRGGATGHAFAQLSLPDSLSCGELIVEVQPVDWPHPPLLGRDVFAARRCDFRLADGVIEVEPAHAPPGLRCFAPWRTGPKAAVRWGDMVVEAIWDTGAGITVVDRRWAEDHPEAVDIMEESVGGVDVTGATIAGSRGRIAACTVADEEFPEQVCGVVDLSELNARLADPIIMVLGLPQIVQANWYLDFRTQVLGVHPLAGRYSSDPEQEGAC